VTIAPIAPVERRFRRSVRSDRPKPVAPPRRRIRWQGFCPHRL